MYICGLWLDRSGGEHEHELIFHNITMLYHTTGKRQKTNVWGYVWKHVWGDVWYILANP
jgi:hypothetical protein